MSGGGDRHIRITGNIFYHLRTAARGGQCGVFVNGMKLRIDQGRAFIIRM